MSRASQKFDQKLFELKTRELNHQMQIKSEASNNAAFQGMPVTGRGSALAGPASTRIVDGQLSLLGEWLEGIDRTAREVWGIQDEAVTPEFVRDVLVPEAMMLISSILAVCRFGRKIVTVPSN